MGSTGEYSDRSEWCICALEDEEAAKDYVTKLDTEFKIRWAEFCSNDGRKKSRSRYFPPGWNKYDPTGYPPDYTGIGYWYQKIPMGPLA
jgi:hypothetical protein